jgi:hypothetical protein
MKKIFITLILLVGTLTFSQTTPKTKNIDKDINVLLDSLSKVYKVKVGSVIVEDYPNLRVTSIAYYQNDELTYKVIKTEKNPTKRNIFGNY